jgi:hypothetical protein
LKVGSGPIMVNRVRAAHIEDHGDVTPVSLLEFDNSFWSEEVFRAVEMRTETDAFSLDLTQFLKAEDLVAARIGQDRAVPGGEPAQTACLTDQIDSWAQIEVIGVSQHHRGLQFGKVAGGQRLDGSGCADRHENRGGNYPSIENQRSGAGFAAGRIEAELECG